MFVSAWSNGATQVVYRDDAGVETTRSGGSRSWRNCNPGNISKGSFADSCGAIGGDARFAIFPDEQIGLAAIETLFRSRSYASLSLRDAIYRYAPSDDGNDSPAYVAVVAKAVGVDPSTPVRILDDGQLADLAAAIQRHEGWRPGTLGPAHAAHSPAASAGGPIAPPHGPNPAAMVDGPVAPPRAPSPDVALVPRLIEIASDPERCQEIRASAFQAMARIYGKPTSHNACACTLSMFLRAAGIAVDVEYGAGNLARILERQRQWTRVRVGQQQPGDVGVTQDRISPAGADHIYLVVRRIDGDRMLIADNQQRMAPHPRSASGQTPTEYFLRASGGTATLGAPAAPPAASVDDVALEDEDTNSLSVAYDVGGAPL